MIYGQRKCIFQELEVAESNVLGYPCPKKRIMSLDREKYDETDYEKQYKTPKIMKSRSTQVGQSNIIGLSFFERAFSLR